MKASLTLALAASVALVALFSWWFQLPWYGVAGYAVFSLLALLAVPLSYRWFGFHDDDAISALHAQEQREHVQMLQRLEQLQSELSDQENSEGASQAANLTKLLKDFHDVIGNRFGGKQLAASSYLGAARRVQNQALQNLSDMVGIGHSIASLRRQRDEKTLQEQQQRVSALLDNNRHLFDALTATSVEVANIQEIGEFERTETLARLKDLTLLARHKGQ